MDSPPEPQAALAALSAMLARSERALERLRPGTAAHTLLTRRNAALAVAMALIRGDTPLESRALEQAGAPLASLLSKSEKALPKLGPGSWQHTQLGQNIAALRLAMPLLEAALKKVHRE